MTLRKKPRALSPKRSPAIRSSLTTARPAPEATIPTPRPAARPVPALQNRGGVASNVKVSINVKRNGLADPNFTFNIDTMAPSLYHTPVNQDYEYNNLVVACTASDNVAITDVILYYRTTGTAEWKSLSMIKNNDKYSATIYGSDITLSGIEYYIVATDNVNTVTKGSADAPYSVVIKSADALLGKGDVDGSGDVTTKDALNDIAVLGSRCSFAIAEAQTNKTCRITPNNTSISTAVEQEFSLSYRFSTYQIASGSAVISYDPELFEVVGVTNGAFLSNKVADINTNLAGAVYLSFVGTEYIREYDILTVTFRTIRNVADTSQLLFQVTELHDTQLQSISCPVASTDVSILYDQNYTPNAPQMRLSAEYDSTTEQVTAVITLEENAKLGAGDFVIGFEPAVLTLSSYQKGFAPTFFTVNDKEAGKGVLKFSTVSLSDIITAQTVITAVFDVTFTCDTDGYTGDTCCVGCGEKLEDGEPIPGGHAVEGVVISETGVSIESEAAVVDVTNV